MANQVSLLAIPEDMRSLLLPVEQEGAKAFPMIVPVDETPRPVSPSEYATLQSGESFLLLPSPLAAVEIFYTPLTDDPTRAQVDDFNSPVVIVDSCVAEDGCLFNGRLFLGNDPSDPRHTAARRLFKTLGNALKSWEKTARFGIFVGPETAKQARGGKLTLRHHALTLELP